MYSKMSQLYKNVSSPFASFVSIRNICSISSYYFWLTIAEVAGVERLPRGTLMQDLFNIMARLLNITLDRKSTRLNSSHVAISYAVFCLKKKNNITRYFTVISHIYK